MGSRGRVRFGSARLQCGEAARVYVETREAAPGDVRVTTSAGDCDVLPLELADPTDADPDIPQWLWQTAPFTVTDWRDPAYLTRTDTCADAGNPSSDGVIFVDDDGAIDAQFTPQVGIPNDVLRASARMTCRDVILDRGTSGDNPLPVKNDCSSSPGPLLKPDQTAHVEAVLDEEPGSGTLEGGWIEARSDHPSVLVPHRGAVLEQDPIVGWHAWILVDVLPDACTSGPPTVNVTLEMWLAGGRRERAYVSLALDCSASGPGIVARPGEVPDGSLRVTKPDNTLAQLVWSAAPPPAGGSTACHAAWMGDLTELRLGVYDHQMLGCVGSQLEILDDLTLQGPRQRYYLVGGRSECGSAAWPFEGSLGNARHYDTATGLVIREWPRPSGTSTSSCNVGQCPP